MSLLYHLPFSANCRLVRIALAENKVSFRLVVEAIWERRDSFLALNPEGQVPVFINEQNLKNLSEEELNNFYAEVKKITK